MAVTLDIPGLAVAIRAAGSTEAIPPGVQTVLGYILPATTALIVSHAPKAPDDIHNAAAIRLAGWLYEADPTDSRMQDAVRVSGAAVLLAPFREHQAGVLGPGAQLEPPADRPIPAPPGDGSFILRSVNGELTWLPFPSP
ncbi:MAG: hypothetical protein OXQ29_03520 [Rhodospirillaceae bacterium]|nr:hypothetical protein [Rhodospirillaceae bacterium]